MSWAEEAQIQLNGLPHDWTEETRRRLRIRLTNNTDASLPDLWARFFDESGHMLGRNLLERFVGYTAYPPGFAALMLNPLPPPAGWTFAPAGQGAVYTPEGTSVVVRGDGTLASRATISQAVGAGNFTAGWTQTGGPLTVSMGTSAGAADIVAEASYGAGTPSFPYTSTGTTYFINFTNTATTPVRVSGVNFAV